MSVRCAHSVEQTVSDLQRLLTTKGARIFAVVDHAGEARAAGLEMLPTVLLIFGNPRAGTPLMIASPLVAIELPLKLLVSEDAEGAVWISYAAPSQMQTRYELPEELSHVLNVVETVAISFT